MQIRKGVTFIFAFLFLLASSSLNFSLICQEMSMSKVFFHFLVPLAVKRLNNLPIMGVKYSLLKMHVSLNEMPFGNLQTLTTLSQSLVTQNGLGRPPARSCFLSCWLASVSWSKERAGRGRQELSKGGKIG